MPKKAIYNYIARDLARASFVLPFFSAFFWVVVLSFCGLERERDASATLMA
jgi:hypothetical protein